MQWAKTMKNSRSELESETVRKITVALAPLGVVFKVHGGRYQSTGFPDILFWRNGVAYAFEVKRPGGTYGVTPLQAETLARLREQGVVACVVTSAEKALNMIADVDAYTEGKTREHFDFNPEDVEIFTEDVSTFLGENRGGT